MGTRLTARIGISSAKSTLSQRGFTLAEVLVAMLIVTISALAILPLLWNSIDENSAVHLRSKAKEVAVQKVEELTSLPQDAVDHYLGSGTTYTSSIEYVTADGAVTDDKTAQFQRMFNISQVPDLVIYPKPVIFTCVVRYPYRGKIRSCSFCTMGTF